VALYAFFRNFYDQETVGYSPSTNWNLEWSAQGKQQQINPPRGHGAVVSMKLSDKASVTLSD
jgi:hypothetical protein